MGWWSSRRARSATSRSRRRSPSLHSFAHLFVELSSPQVARQVLDRIQAMLAEQGYAVEQSAFGWFNRLEIKAKGHPLSRVARQV